MTPVTLTYVPASNRYMVEAAYDENLVQILKSIDHQNREYDVETKRWFFDSWLRDHLVIQMEQAGFQIRMQAQVMVDLRTEATAEIVVSARKLGQWLNQIPDELADESQWHSFIHEGCAMGVRMLLLSGDPAEDSLDMRSPTQRRIEDGAAQDEARRAGHPDWDLVRSENRPTNSETHIRRYISRFRKTYGEESGIVLGVAI